MTWTQKLMGVRDRSGTVLDHTEIGVGCSVQINGGTRKILARFLRSVGVHLTGAIDIRCKKPRSGRRPLGNVMERFSSAFLGDLETGAFALRKGRSYGTLMTDRQHSVAADMIESIAAKRLVTWLPRHPRVELLARDRDRAYSSAGQAAFPLVQRWEDRPHWV